MKKFGLELNQKSKQLMKITILWKNLAKIGINTDDNLHLNKPLKFPTLTIIIRCVFREGKKLYKLWKYCRTKELVF